MFNEDVRDRDDEVSGLVRARAVGLAAPFKLAAFDLGSNSFHAVVALLTDDGRFTICERAKERVRLGESVFQGGCISTDGVERGLRAVRTLREVVRPYAPHSVVAVATSAIREASNGREFVRRASVLGGFAIQIIDGLEEARLVCLGARQASSLRGQRSLLVDFGGGSTEVVLADDHGCLLTASLPLGSLRLRGRLGALERLQPVDLQRLEQTVAQAIAPTLAHVRGLGFDVLVFSCGTARKLLELATNARFVDDDLQSVGDDGEMLSLRALQRLEALLASSDGAGRASLLGKHAREAETLLLGAIGLRVMMERAGVGRARVSRTGLREGLIVDQVAKMRATAVLSLAHAL